MRSPDRFGVLTVCTGNICRSPAAAFLLAERLGPSVEVTSAGMFGLIGSAVAPPMARLLRGSGVSFDGFSARRASAGILGSSDLVLAMTTGHRREIVELAPAVVRRTFTLRELARLLGSIRPPELPDGTPADRLRAAIPLVSARRCPSPASDDIDDPFGGTAAAFAQAFAEIEEAVARIATVIAASGHR